ncbi:MAG: type II secretion system protein [Patescibacteria group bacterium]
MQRAFTLFEILVALALFSVVAVTGVSSLSILSSGQQKTIFAQTNQDNIRFALEALSREIRTGADYEQGPGSRCDGLLDATQTDDECFSYIIQRTVAGVPITHTVILKRSINNPLECAGGLSCIVKKDSIDGVFDTEQFLPVTAPEVDIEMLRFFIAGASSDLYQSRVTILMRGITPGVDPRQSLLVVQTTINRNSLD